MPILETIRFQGTLVRDEISVPAGFEASIDDRGELDLVIDPFPFSTEAHRLNLGMGRGQDIPYLTLEGVSAGGETFRSDSFYILKRNHSDGELTYGGACAEAEVVRTLAEPLAKPQIIYGLRGFQCFRSLTCETSLGRVRLSGSTKLEPGSQVIAGFIQMFAPDMTMEAIWWDQADAEMNHILRVMSVASGVYLLPYLERRIEGVMDRFKVVSRSETPAPFMPPFTFMNLEPIFQAACACDPGVRAQFETMDAAIRWLLTPGYYDEVRLMVVMTALENIIDEAFPPASNSLAAKKLFERFSKGVRALIDEMQMPSAMKTKLPELNRPNFIDKLKSFIAARQIVIADFPQDGLRNLIKARNRIVHQGVYFDGDDRQTDLWDHIKLGRELVTRILLQSLGFQGNYFSIINPERQLRFPSARRLADENGIEIPADDPRGEPRALEADDLDAEGPQDGPRTRAGSRAS